jgi:hypothetical protein
VKLFNFSLGLALLIASVPAHATVVSSSYQVGFIPSPPPSVQFGALVNNGFIVAFAERQNVTLTNSLKVDITAPNVVYTQKAQIPGGLILAGKVVNSYYLHANINVSKVKFPAQYVGFSQNEVILGLIVDTGTLESSNPVLGAPNTTYTNSGSGFGLHFEPTGVDSISFTPADSANYFTNLVNVSEVVTSANCTDFRVVTQIVPGGATTTPMAAGFALSGIAGLVLLGMRPWRKS